VIEAEAAIVSPEALGQSLTAIVEVTLDTDRPNGVEEFQRAIQAAPEVMQAYYVTGNADYILVITARNMANYEAFARKFLSKKPHVKYSRTSIVMRRVKRGLTLPLTSDWRVPSG
jgi:Lrp/AsnC family leucine-responsive transcriptional regulator